MWCLSVIRKIREDVGLSVYPAPLQTPASAQKELEMLPVRGLDPYVVLFLPIKDFFVFYSATLA